MGISRLIRNTNETTPPPPMSTFSDIDGGGCGEIKAHQAYERNNTAATDVDFLRHRRRRMWGYRGSSGTRTKQHRHHRYRLTPISVVADVGISRLIRHTNETTPPPQISTDTDIDGGGCGDIEAHQAHKRYAGAPPPPHPRGHAACVFRFAPRAASSAYRPAECRLQGCRVKFPPCRLEFVAPIMRLGG